MSDLAMWLLAQIAEDERVALSGVKFESWNRSWDTEPLRDIAVGGQRVGTVSTDYDEHICRWNPARVLAECEAKRRIVEECSSVFRLTERLEEAHLLAVLVLQVLALPYADRLGYLAEWAP